MKSDMEPYHNATIIMAEKFENFYIDYVPHQQNAHVDALASLATSLALSVRATKRVFVYSRDLYCCKFAFEDSKTLKGGLQVKEVLETSISLEPRDWRLSYIDFVLYGILPDDHKEKAVIKRKAPQFYYNVIMQTLYLQSYDGILLRCLSHKEAQEALKEAYDSICGAHQPRPKLEDRLRKLGYYWPKISLTPSPMLSDAMHVRSTVILSIKH